MENGCSCFSCCQYRNFDKIDFLKKTKSTARKGRIRTKRTRSGIPIPSNGAFDRVPDEVLFHIFNYLPPNTMDNFLALIALEMVSKRIRSCMIKNSKIWKNVTELVLGFRPDLPDDQYLCHIGHFTLYLLLRRVQKITKVIINLKSEKMSCEWLCLNMVRSKIYPLLDRYAEKFDMRELTIHKKLENGTEELLVKKLIENGGKESLERIQINRENFSHGISSIFAECTSLKNVKLSDINHSVFGHHNIAHDLRQFKFVEVLEISGCTEKCITNLYYYIIYTTTYVGSFALHTIRLTNPNFLVPRFSFELLPYIFTLDHLSLREFEIHCCPIVWDISNIPKFLNGLSYPIHLNLVICPCLDVNHFQILVQLLKNGQRRNVDGMKITLTFNHWDGYRVPRMAAVRNLLESFDVPYDDKPEHGDVWTFIRGKLNVTLKLKIVEHNKVMCQLG